MAGVSARKVCPLCDEVGMEQRHRYYPDPQMGDTHHGQFDPDDPNDPVYSYTGDELGGI